MQTRMDTRDSRRWYRCTLASGEPPVRIKTWSADEAARIVSRVFGEQVVFVLDLAARRAGIDYLVRIGTPTQERASDAA